nr:reverse transcriptase domain-containing protein [Tanacetum cinerariifolium]
MENANTSCSTYNMEFLDPNKKKEIESWLRDSRIIDSLDGLNEIEYFDTFLTMEELEYHEWLLKYPKPPWVKDTTSIIDHPFGEVIFGKPFTRNTGLVYDQEEGTVTFKNDDEKLTFKMPHKMETSNHIDFKNINTDSIPPFILRNNDDHGKTYYSDSLTLGSAYKDDKSISKEIQHLMKLEREAKRYKREVIIWKAFGGNTRDLGSFGEETDKITDLHQIYEELLLTEREDGVVGQLIAPQEDDIVWIHLCKEHFLTMHFGKLKPRGDGPFRVLKKINDNACKIELPGHYNVSATFNVVDLSPYKGDSDDNPESGSSLFKKGRMMQMQSTNVST